MAETKSLTPAQLRVMQTIREYRRAHGSSPTYQEVADALCMSKTAAADHIKHCINKGVLKADPGRRRSIEPVDEELIPRHDALGAVDAVAAMEAPADDRLPLVKNKIEQIQARR